MSRFVSLLVCFCALLSPLHAEEEEEHAHWEWGALFEVSSSASTRNTFELRNTGEEDPLTFAASFFVTSCASGDEEGFEEAEEKAEIYFEAAEHDGNVTHTSDQAVAVEVDTVYSVAYSNVSWITAVTVTFPSDGFYAIFVDHHPSELCGEEHYEHCFRDQTGEEVELIMEEEQGDHDHGHHDEDSDEDRAIGDRWMYTILGCALVWMVVFSGLLFVVCGTEKYEHFSKNYIHLMNLFASGAIFATVLFLIVVEALHFLDTIGASEGEVSALFGSAILLGFISPTLIELLFYREDIEVTGIISDHDVDMVERVKVKPVHSALAVESSVQIVAMNNTADADGEIEKQTNEDTMAASESDVRAAEKNPGPDTCKVNSIIVSVVCGDFLHNFCDGIFIGVAARSCSLSLLWAIIFATMFHEFAQEVSDFVILTTKVGLPIPRALWLNAAGGSSVILGGIFTNAFNLSDFMIGMLLAYGSGNLIYLSCAELFPLLHATPAGQKKLSNQDKMRGILCFCVGAAVIGLTLLKHEHCEDSDHAHDH